ncbi:MAG: N(4)-(beta-N-acetylglucosaminyl)-L-asparaginase [Gillisia sp.]
MKRRRFIEKSALAGAAISLSSPLLTAANRSFQFKNMTVPDSQVFPLTIATWNFPNASKKAGELLANGASALDAAEQGVMVEEANIKNTTVGKGGAPDRDGNVTLDASIMNPQGNAGSVAYLKNYTHAVSVARKVMEETPHVMLVGEGADQFAKEMGFKEENLLTPESEEAYHKWLEKKHYQPIINIENHDTIGMLCIDKNGDLAGACTTSGLSYKMNGRVGDSPIIGAGLYLDNKVGGAAATGMGEVVMKTLGSFLIVEKMREGKSPQEACEIAVQRIIEGNPNYKDFQAAFIAVNKKGEIGSYCIQQGFSYVKYQNGKNENIPSAFFI